MTNLVFRAWTRAAGIYFNNKKEYLYVKKKTFYHIKSVVNNIPFIQYNEIEDLVDQLFAIFKILIIELRKSAAYWYKIINYAGPKAIKYL